MKNLTWIRSNQGNLINQVALLKNDSDIILSVIRCNDQFVTSILNPKYSFTIKNIPYQVVYTIAKKYFEKDCSNDEKERVTLGYTCYMVENEVKKQLCET